MNRYLNGCDVLGAAPPVDGPGREVDEETALVKIAIVLGMFASVTTILEFIMKRGRR